MKNTDFIYPLNNFPYYQNIITINYYYYIKHSLNMSALIHASSAIPYQITRIILKNMNVKEIPAGTTTVFPPLIKFV